MIVQKLFKGKPEKATLQAFLNTDGNIFISIEQEDGSGYEAWITLSVEEATLFSEALIEEINLKKNEQTD